VLPELRTKRSEALIDRGKSLLLLGTELCPRLDEALPRLFENPIRLAVEIETFTPRVKIVDAGKQRFIHEERREMPRHLRCDGPLQLLDVRIGVRPGTQPEDRRHLAECIASQFQSSQRVLDARLIRISGYR